ncbi:hypothetical protein WJX72_012032 [[Myrmecia] bisecta]|uniref:GAF domain-containing protein n=1 Tax=[Myrmecia] bisecta TaxID=41462 RepID=A0AAW1QU04_9CHLO
MNELCTQLARCVVLGEETRPDLPELINRILPFCEVVSVALVGQEGEHLLLYPVVEGGVPVEGRLTAVAKCSAGTAVWAAFQTGQQVVLGSQSSWNVSYKDWGLLWQRYRVRNLVTAPLEAAEGLLGALTVGSTRPHALNMERIQALSVLLGQCLVHVKCKYDLQMAIGLLHRVYPQQVVTDILPEASAMPASTAPPASRPQPEQALAVQHVSTHVPGSCHMPDCGQQGAPAGPASTAHVAANSAAGSSAPASAAGADGCCAKAVEGRALTFLCHNCHAENAMHVRPQDMGLQLVSQPSPQKVTGQRQAGLSCAGPSSSQVAQDPARQEIVPMPSSPGSSSDGGTPQPGAAPLAALASAPSARHMRWDLRFQSRRLERNFVRWQNKQLAGMEVAHMVLLVAINLVVAARGLQLSTYTRQAALVSLLGPVLLFLWTSVSLQSGPFQGVASVLFPERLRGGVARWMQKRRELLLGVGRILVLGLVMLYQACHPGEDAKRPGAVATLLGFTGIITLVFNAVVRRVRFCCHIQYQVFACAVVAAITAHAYGTESVYARPLLSLHEMLLLQFACGYALTSILVYVAERGSRVTFLHRMKHLAKMKQSATVRAAFKGIGDNEIVRTVQTGCSTFFQKYDVVSSGLGALAVTSFCVYRCGQDPATALSITAASTVTALVVNELFFTDNNNNSQW